MISIGESYKQVLNELQWLEKVTSHVNELRIPVTSKIYGILYGKQRINVFHISDIWNINNMKNLIGTKKVISTFSRMTEYRLNDMSGIQTQGGIIYQIDGELVLSSTSDIMSRPDENGIRWIDYYELLPYPLTSEWASHIRNNIFDDFPELEYDRQKKTNQIKRYFRLAEEFVAEHKDKIIKKISERGGSGMGTWDEILVSDIRIIDIYWSTDYANRIYNKLKAGHDYYGNNRKLTPRTLYILNHFPEWVDKIHKKLESMAEGKVYTSNDMDPVNFVKERGGGVVDNNKGKSLLHL